MLDSVLIELSSMSHTINVGQAIASQYLSHNVMLAAINRVTQKALVCGKIHATFCTKISNICYRQKIKLFRDQSPNLHAC